MVRGLPVMQEVQIAWESENSQPLSVVMDREREAKRSGSRSLLFIDEIIYPTTNQLAPFLCLRRVAFNLQRA